MMIGPKFSQSLDQGEDGELGRWRCFVVGRVVLGGGNWSVLLLILCFSVLEVCEGYIKYHLVLLSSVRWWVVIFWIVFYEDFLWWAQESAVNKGCAPLKVSHRQECCMNFTGRWWEVPLFIFSSINQRLQSLPSLEDCLCFSRPTPETVIELVKCSWCSYMYYRLIIMLFLESFVDNCSCLD